MVIEAPYAFKLFIQELETAGIATRLIAEKILEHWDKLQGYESTQKNLLDYNKIFNKWNTAIGENH